MKQSKVHRQCIEILRDVVATGITKQFTKRILEAVITVYRGGDPRTLQNWTNNLIRLGFITRYQKRNAVIYELNLECCSELFNDLVRPGQKKLM